MANDNQIAFLCSRLKEFREKNGCTMADMAKKIDVLEGLEPGTGMNKSSISRVEGGKTAEKTLLEMARKYCKVFGMSESQTEQFLRGEKAAVPDTSALLKNSQLIDELNKEYSKVVIPKVVVDELDNIKNKNSGSLGRKAWEVIRGISYGSRTILMEYNGDADEDNEDCKIIYIAQEASDTYHCKVDIITEDTDYSAYLKGHESVSALHLREYMATKQDLINMTKLARIDAYYADSYEECEEPTADEVNAYLQDGNTLIISAVRNNRVTIEQRKEKIKWLIQLGADVNKRDCSRRYFPALSHAVQMKDYEMFMFLLLECKANPNVGSRNPFDAGKVRQKNEGNMPLMIAAWEGKKDFVIALCEDERTSINQQDANGFTALMKACMNGHFENNKEKHTWDIRKIGEKIGRHIAAVFPEKNTSILVLERGGRFFGDGVYMGAGGIFYSMNPKQDDAPVINTERVVIVDSVINTGKSIMRIIDELKNHNPGIDVIIAANVIQNEAVELFKDYLVFATRLSKNSFVGVNQSKQTGKTGPDTADRLFNLIKKRY